MIEEVDVVSVEITDDELTAVQVALEGYASWLTEVGGNEDIAAKYRTAKRAITDKWFAAKRAADDAEFEARMRRPEPDGPWPEPYDVRGDR